MCRLGFVYRGIGLLLAGWLLAGAASAYAEIPWRKATFSASKFLLKLTASIEITEHSKAEAAVLLGDAFQGQVMMPADTVIRIRVRLDFIGRSSVREGLLDAVPAGSALQMTRVQRRGKLEYRRDRYSTSGMARTRKTSKIRQLPLADWPDSGRVFKPYPAMWQQPDAISLSDALLYMMAMRDLYVPGDETTFYIFEDDRIVQIQLRVLEQRSVAVDFRIKHANQAALEPIKGRRDALRIGVTTKDVGTGGGGGNIDLFGLQKNISVLMDSKTRAPLVVRGRAKGLGKIKLRLRSLELATHDN